MKSPKHILRIVVLGATIFLAQTTLAAQEVGQVTVSVLTRNGELVNGTTNNLAVRFGKDKNQVVELSNILSIHSADPASEQEQEIIEDSLARLGNTVEPAAETAAAKLVDIGLPVMSPLLKGYADTEAKEPDYKYRLFGRIMPGRADSQDRTLDLIRLADGTMARGKLLNKRFVLRDEAGQETTVVANDIRRIAVLQDKVERSFELHALHHCTYVGFMDVGIVTTSSSNLDANAEGYVRLSFDEDGWAADPHGIVTPLEGKRKLQEGFRWGSVLARVGPEGDRWFVGKQIEKSDLGTGRLYFVINDNEHWQNNIGSFRVQVTVTNAYDIGEPY